MRDQESISAILHKPFTLEHLEFKIQTAGNTNGRIWARIVPYVSARAISDRLNEAFGPFGYSIQTEPIALGNVVGMKCQIGATVPNDGNAHPWQSVVREDVCEVTDIEAMKGAASGALKRAAVLFGIGRYLYDAPEFYALIGDNHPNRGSYKDKETNRPVFFKWALPPEVYAWVGAPAPVPQKSPAEMGYRDKTTTPAEATTARRVSNAATEYAGGEIPKVCPVCQSSTYDNRKKKAAGEYKETYPDWTCSLKTCQTEGRRTGGYLKSAKAESDGAGPGLDSDIPIFDDDEGGAY